MKKLKIIVLCLLAMGFISSCNKEEISKEITQQQEIEPTQAQLDKLSGLKIDTGNVIIQEIKMLDGSKESYLIANDLLISVSDLAKYPEPQPEASPEKQYRHPFIVAPPYRNINILGYTGGGGFALTAKMQTALSWAVANYNVLPNTLNFNLTFGTNTGAADMIVYRVNTPSAGGSAMIPNATGQPGRFIRINAGTDAFSTNVNEHVIGHEIGHAVGLAHPGTGIWIPGTPISPSEPSIMQPSFPASADGELTPSDKLALNILY